MIKENKENYYLKVFENHYSINSKILNISNVEKILLNFCHLQDLIQKNVNELANVFGETLKAQKMKKSNLLIDKDFKIKNSILKENLQKELFINKNKSKNSKTQPSIKTEKIQTKKNRTSFTEFLKHKNFNFQKKNQNQNQKQKKKSINKNKKRIVGLKYEQKRYLEGISCFECINVIINSFIMH